MSGYKPKSIISEYNSVQVIHVEQISTNIHFREEIYTKQFKSEIERCVSYIL